MTLVANNSHLQLKDWEMRQFEYTWANQNRDQSATFPPILFRTDHMALMPRLIIRMALTACSANRIRSRRKSSIAATTVGRTIKPIGAADTEFGRLGRAPFDDGAPHTTVISVVQDITTPPRSIWWLPNIHGSALSVPVGSMVRRQ